MRVMYVEDDPRDAELLSQALQEAEPDVQIQTVGTVAEARALLENADAGYSSCDVLLTDMGLPDGSGLSLLPLVRDRQLPTAVVVLAGRGGEEAAVDALKSGANDFVVKTGDYLRFLPGVLRDAWSRQAAEQARQANPLRVLYATADGDLDILRRYFLRFAPWIRLEVVRSPLEVIWRLVDAREKAPPFCDVLLLDSRLDGANAIDMLKALRENGDLPVPVVIAADPQDEEIAAQALRLHATDYVLKNGAFASRLPAVLDNARQRLRISREKAALEASVRIMGAILDSSPVAVISLDAEGKVRSWNPAATHMFGWTEAEVTGRPVPFLAGERVGDFQGFLARTLAGEPITNVEARRARRDGTPVEVSISTAPLRDSAGRVTGAVWMVSDITERRRNEQTISEQARLLDLAPDAMMVRGADERMLYCNEAAVRLFGYPRVELESLPMIELLVPDDVPRLQEARRLLARDGEWEGELRARRKNASVITVLARWSLLRDAQGLPRARFAIVRDVSRQKEMEKRLRRTQRMESLGTLASGIAHDLNNILSPVMMSVDMLRTRHTAPEDQRILQILDTSVHRGSDIVRQMLSFARGNEGEMVPLQLRNVTREIEAILRETFPRNIEIGLDIPADLPQLVGDATQLHQVILNLCVNARDVLPNGGRIEIQARAGRMGPDAAEQNPGARPGPCVILSVIDNGTGIPPGIRERIFDPFFTTKEKGKGTGLGLSTVQSIVHGHGGYLQFESSQEKGTRFDIFLPAVPPPARGEREEPSAAIPLGSGETILVIDDDASILGITRQILESYGYRVISAESGIEALEGVKSGRWGTIQLVLADLYMPAMGGRQTVEAIRQVRREIPVIIMSGMPTAGDSPALEKLTVQGIIAKPFKAEELLALIRDVLDSEPGRSGLP